MFRSNACFFRLLMNGFFIIRCCDLLILVFHSNAHGDRLKPILYFPLIFHTLSFIGSMLGWVSYDFSLYCSSITSGSYDKGRAWCVSKFLIQCFQFAYIHRSMYTSTAVHMYTRSYCYMGTPIREMLSLGRPGIFYLPYGDQN